MIKETFESLINQVYQTYWNNIPTKGDRTYLHKQGFIEKIMEDPEFSKEWDLGIVKEEFTYEERYDYWFMNNYETGMEHCPEIVPDFDNSYYQPTPTKKMLVKHKDKNYVFYV
jgi:hypothetical protein